MYGSEGGEGGGGGGAAGETTHQKCTVFTPTGLSHMRLAQLCCCCSAAAPEEEEVLWKRRPAVLLAARRAAADRWKMGRVARNMVVVLDMVVTVGFRVRRVSLVCWTRCQRICHVMSWVV